MNNWKFYLGAFGMLSLVSCTNDELTSVNRDGDEITFNVVTSKHSRAISGGIYDNNNLSEFYVSAVCNGKKFIGKDKITKGSDGYWKDENTRYWPTNGDKVTFFGYYGVEDGSFTFDATKPTVSFTVKKDVKDQVDFIYARSVEVNKRGGVDPVDLFFRHALSQIVFKAKNTNKNLFVQIKGVTVCNLDGGTKKYFFPKSDTRLNKKENGEKNDLTPDNFGSWKNTDGSELVGSGECYYEVSTDAVVNFNGNNESKDFTSSTNNAMLLLPQTTNAWNLTTTIKETNEDGNAVTRTAKPSEQSGSYFLVKCLIWNVAAGNSSEEDYDPMIAKDVCLWGKENKSGDVITGYEAKDVAIPVDIDWKEGMKYTYTFVFGDGNGGYDPEKPEPVLVPITFNVSVDGFDNVDKQIDMDKPKSEQSSTAN